MRVLAVLVLLILAGCATPGADEKDGDGAPPTAASRFLAPQDLGEGGAEPVVAYAPEGTHVYVAAQDAEGGSPRVWISDDHGATWTMTRPNAQGGGEVDVAAGPRGAVYVTQLGPRGNVVSVSDDHGATWQTAPLGGPSQYFDREWMAVDAQGRAYVVAREFGTTASAGVARSDDGGLTWPPRGKAWTTLDEPGEANGNMIAVGNAVHLVYICRGAEAVCVTTSRDGGLSWERNLVAQRGVGTANVYPSLAATSRGLVAAWSDATDGTLAVYVATSADGKSWSAPRRATPAGGTATLPWVAARGDVAWVAYLHTDKALRATDCGDATDAQWVPHAVPLGLDGAPRGEPSALTTTPVHVGVISPPVGQTCSGAGRDRFFGDFFTATVTPAGKLLVATSADDGTFAGTRDVVIRER